MRRILAVVVLSALVIVLVACGGGNTTTQSANTPLSGMVFVNGSDAPLPAVMSFQVNISSLTLSNGSTSVELDNPGTVEFSRLLGLRTLLSLGSVPVGTYTSATIKLAAPVISYLDMSATPPTVTTMNGTLLNDTVTVALNPALVVGSSQLGGLHLHFDLRNSLLTDGAGQITGQVAPQIQMRVLQVNDPEHEIDELRGGVQSVDVANNVFVMQRPHGRLVTVHVNGSTQWFPASESLSTITPPVMVEISGKVQADGSLLADSVEVLTRDHAFLGGLILDVNPPSGDANQVTMLVRTEMPDLSGISVPGATTLNITSTTQFDIRSFHLPIETFLFNRHMMVRGQRIGVGGLIDNATTPASLAVRRVVLRRQGVDGVPANVQVNSGNNGTFTLTNAGLFGYILGGTPLKVMTSNMTVFRRLSGLADVANAHHVRVVGLVLKDPATSTPVLVAGYVEKLD